MSIVDTLNAKLDAWLRAHPRLHAGMLYVIAYVMIFAAGFALTGMAGAAPVGVQVVVLPVLIAVPLLILLVDHLRPALGKRWRARHRTQILLPMARVPLLVIGVFAAAAVLGYLSADQINLNPDWRR